MKDVTGVNAAVWGDKIKGETRLRNAWLTAEAATVAKSQGLSHSKIEQRQQFRSQLKSELEQRRVQAFAAAHTAQTAPRELALIRRGTGAIQAAAQLPPIEARQPWSATASIKSVDLGSTSRATPAHLDTQSRLFNTARSWTPAGTTRSFGSTTKPVSARSDRVLRGTSTPESNTGRKQYLLHRRTLSPQDKYLYAQTTSQEMSFGVNDFLFNATKPSRPRQKVVAREFYRKCYE
eukprot:m.3602 g.3602  ORF g.3602 m.3602 type:complete len:235 (-) comp4250_c0_seq1:416-1120(-)